MFWLKILWINYAFFSRIYVLWKLSMDLAVRSFWSKKQGKWAGMEKSWILKITPPEGKMTSICLCSQAHAEQAATKSFIIQLQNKMIFPTYLIMIWGFENEKEKAKGGISCSLLVSHAEGKKWEGYCHSLEERWGKAKISKQWTNMGAKLRGNSPGEDPQCGHSLILPSPGSCRLQMRLTFQMWLREWWHPEQKWRNWE